MLKLDILVHPTFSEPTLQPVEVKKSVAKQWKFPWRICMLAKPRPPITKKYEPPPPEASKVFGPLDPAIEFRADQLARPCIRMLLVNRRMYHNRGPKFVKTINKNLDKSWNSIYNYYSKRLRDRHLKRLRKKLERQRAKKPKGKSLEKIETLRKERLVAMSKPRKVFPPAKIERKWKPIEELTHVIDVLATPKEYHIVPARKVGVVNPKALEYEITEQILKLAQIPDRFKQRYSDIVLGSVKKSALLAKCTERIEKLAQPSFSAREAKKLDEDKYDPWIISPNALKYKPSARILEMAKPLERD